MILLAKYLRAGVFSLSWLHSVRESGDFSSSAMSRLLDARNMDLALESRFDLAYNAAHALALCALRSKGYRSSNRYIVFPVLPHTLALDLKCGVCWTGATTPATWVNMRACWMLMKAWSLT